MMSGLTHRMNDILHDWRSRYDILSSVSMEFQEDEIGQLCFCDKPLCLTSGLEMESARYDAERILFDFTGQRRIQLSVAWPEESSPYVTSIFLGYYGLK